MIFLMYGKSDCPWCDKAKDLILRDPENTFDYIDVTGFKDATSKMMLRSTLKSFLPVDDLLTVPQIFILKKIILPQDHTISGMIPTNLMKGVKHMNYVEFYTYQHIGGYNELEKYMKGSR